MLRKRLSQVGLITISLAALVVVAQPLHVFAGEILATSVSTSDWLSAEAPRVTKTGDLPADQIPYSKSLDCNEQTVIDPKYKQPITGCIESTGAGTMIGGLYSDGVNQYARIFFVGLLQSYGESQLVHEYSTDLTYIRPALTKSQLVFNRSSNSPGYNYVPSGSPKLLTSQAGLPIYLDTFNMAYSNNGKWLVAGVTRAKVHGLMVFDTEAYTGKFIAPLTGSTLLFGNNATPGAHNFAISDDGRHVAVSLTQVAQNATERGVRIYDTTTCTDQYNVALKDASYCNYKNVWTGKLNGITKISAGIQEQLAETVERPLNVRFKDANTITFSGIYDYVMATNTMKAATYEATIAPAAPPPIKLLALGDSYISGEGAYSYVAGTDTSNNKCHQSTLSYPYLLGAQYADEYHSVACSGAVTDNIYSGITDYPNQLRNKTPQRSYAASEKQEIFAAFHPGYIEQYNFVKQSTVNTILLSIGGNDIHFADIVTVCVLSGMGEPCFGKQSERRVLLNLLYNMHKKLTDTYKKILAESSSGTKLYVIGYPQVVNPTGNCGINVHLDDQERQFAFQLIERYNAVLKNAAKSAGAVYVDTSTALVGHRLCDPTADGVNGLTNGDDRAIGAWVQNNSYSFGIGNESYHPTALGHRLLSTAIATATDNLTKNPTAPNDAGKLNVKGDEQFITSGTSDNATIRKLIFNALTNSVVVAKKQVLSIVSGFASGVAANVAYTIVMHSDEVTLYSGIADANGEISTEVTVPNITPGMHSIHIYTTNTDGEQIDIMQNIFVIASSSDYDGDGINNTDDPEPFVNDTGKIIVSGYSEEDDQASSIGDQDTSGANVENESDTDATEKANIAITLAAAAKVNALPIQNNIADPQTDTSYQGVVLGEANGLAAAPQTSDLYATQPKATATKHEAANDQKARLAIVVSIAIALLLGGAIFWLKHRLSNKQSVKMQL